jgi:hypothetical protein
LNVPTEERSRKRKSPTSGNWTPPRIRGKK